MKTQLENNNLREEVAHLRRLLAVAQAGPSKGGTRGLHCGPGMAGGGCIGPAGQLALREGTLARVRTAQLERQVLRLEAELKVRGCLCYLSFPHITVTRVLLSFPEADARWHARGKCTGGWSICSQHEATSAWYKLLMPWATTVLWQVTKVGVRASE